MVATGEVTAAAAPAEELLVAHSGPNLQNEHLHEVTAGGSGTCTGQQ
jgi:hypothetical protein